MEKTQISEDDRKNLVFLYRVLEAQRTGLLASFIGQLTTMYGIEKINRKYNGRYVEVPDLSRMAIAALIIAIIAGIMALGISEDKYIYIDECIKKGQLNCSLTPNEDINKANLLGIIANIYGLKAAIGFAEREGISIAFA